MYDFDKWGDWVHERATALASSGVNAVFKDGRAIPELASNPSYVVQVSAAGRLGYIGFWESGLCDIVVIDTITKANVENTSMLEATDETVPHLFERFLVACGFGQSTTGS